MDIFGIIGAVSGIVSLLTVLYFAVAWKTSVDADRKAWRNTCQQYPPAELWMMCKTMWDIYVIPALQDRPDLAERHSPYRLTAKGEDLIPDHIKKQLDEIPANCINQDDISAGWLVVKHIGLNHLSDLAKEQGVLLQEMVAILSTYLDEKLRNHQPTRG